MTVLDTFESTLEFVATPQTTGGSDPEAWKGGTATLVTPLNMLGELMPLFYNISTDNMGATAGTVGKVASQALDEVVQIFQMIADALGQAGATLSALTIAHAVLPYLGNRLLSHMVGSPDFGDNVWAWLSEDGATSDLDRVRSQLYKINQVLVVISAELKPAA